MQDKDQNKPGQQPAADTPEGALAEVRILNDDITPMHFVVDVVQQVFRKDFEAAERIMLATHHDGVGVCGIYPLEIAEAKVTEVLNAAREHDYPLQCVLARGSSVAPKA